MTQYYWSKAAPGLYHLRTTPGGRGPAIATVRRFDDNRGAVIYDGKFEQADVRIAVRERAQPRSFIPLMEKEILINFPDATFERENFI